MRCLFELKYTHAKKINAFTSQCQFISVCKCEITYFVSHFIDLTAVATTFILPPKGKAAAS